MLMKRGMEKAVEDIVAKLKDVQHPGQGQEGPGERRHRRRQRRREIGKIIAEAMDKVGKDGVITVEEGKTIETNHEFVEGMQFDRGYLSPYFVTNPETMECELEDAYILDLREEDQRQPRPASRCWRRSLQQGKPILIIAEDVDGEALATLVVNVHPARTASSRCAR